MTTRFVCVPLISAFSIFDPRKLPAADHLDGYGSKKLETLINFYCNPQTAQFQEIHADPDGSKPMVSGTAGPVLLSSPEILRHEWSTLRKLMSDHHRGGTMATVVKSVTTSGVSAFFPGIIPLLQIVIVLPVTTASVERGFSCMKLIKTRLRSNLDDISLDQLMRIVIEGPSKLSTSQLKDSLTYFKGLKFRDVPL